MTILSPGSRLIGLDTNVLIRALLQDDPVQAPIAADLLRSLGGSARGFITHVTLVEIYWVLARSRRLPRETCLMVIRRLVETGSLEFEDGEGVVRALALAEAGADFPDALIQGAMELFGVEETVTFDRSAAERLGWRLLDDATRPEPGTHSPLM